ncbi:MAG: potassium channel family protein [Gammaproteobacteria bacterium]|nr:potassium channel family protein [Gammaproteobacteria bacterium]MBU1624797.1 potassium channel family protein [Gammaproteobacteria bacterium]MBU1982641.1 potassium channel family protein [Gammaproteobacteria bacterium]
MKVIYLLGIAGVADKERAPARRWARRLEWPMVGVALWIVLQWYLEETGSLPHAIARIADWLVWLAFLLETLVLTAQVQDKRTYLFGNWLNLLIITAGFPYFWQFAPLIGLLRSVRLVLVVALLLRMSKSARRLLGQHKLGATLIVAFGTMLLSGIIISRIDPSVGDVWDGMWWAWVTMATVGYGDVVPHTGAGRLFASLVVLFGVVLISMLTANLAAFFIGSDVEKIEAEEQESDRLLRDISARLERVEQMLQVQQDKRS